MRWVLLVCLAACGSRPEVATAPAAHTRPLWDDAALAGWGMPLAGLGQRPTYMKAADYYAAPVDNLRM